MKVQRFLIILSVVCVLLFGLVFAYFAHQRINRCLPVPLVAPNILPNANLAQSSDGNDMPYGWLAGRPGVQYGAFALDGDNRSIQLMGIANYVQTPVMAVHTGRSYCFTGHAITDANTSQDTKIQVAFRWLDEAGQLIAENRTSWQPVVLWQQEAPPDHWSSIHAAFHAPEKTRSLQIRIHPASDDRVYLDVMHVQQTTAVQDEKEKPKEGLEFGTKDIFLELEPWPERKQAAISFSYDWETTMAGLIHSRSVGDLYADNDPVQRGLRMREGITNTLNIFRPYGIRATYYTAGYTLLLSNTTKTTFMGNPTYPWATRENRWTANHWTNTPWFAPDPYGTYQSHPAWYAGDLVPLLLRERHDIQSHTFSHFYGGFVQSNDWQDDVATWNQVASWRGVYPARSLAFPWSSSGGMTYANWDVLEQAGITSVTRLSDQSQYNLFPADDQSLVVSPHCIPLPGHERILACPDFYLTPQTTERALEQINRTFQQGGMIDIWSHTEEVVTLEQQEAWKTVVRYVAGKSGLWVAPLQEIADWQQSLQNIVISEPYPYVNRTTFTMTNNNTHDIKGLTLRPTPEERITHVYMKNREIPLSQTGTFLIDIQAGATEQITIWKLPTR